MILLESISKAEYRFYLSLTMSLKWGATVVKPIIGVVLIFSKRFSTELNV